METINSLKKRLIDQISQSNNRDKLEAIDFMICNEEVELTEIERQMLERAEQDVAAGRVVAEDQLKYDIEQWLEGKNKKL